MRRVLNFGSLNIDYVYRVNHFVSKGETISSINRTSFRGGKGLNQSIALGRAGVKAFHAGAVGLEGDYLTEFLEESGIDISYIRHIQESCGHAIIQIDDSGDNCIILFGGANQKINPEQVDSVLSNFTDQDIIVLQNEINCLDYIVDKAYEKGMMIVLNPSPFDANISNLDLSKIGMFFLNEIEASQLVNKDKEDLDGIVTALRGKFSKAKIVLTLGSQGAMYCDKDVVLRQEAIKTDVVDTTAAGDTFTGYFIAGLLEEMPPQKCLYMASKASSITVSRMGAAPSIPYRKEIDTYSMLDS